MNRHARAVAPIVVGIDARGIASDAVCWAAAEAATRRCPLRLMHAFHPPALINPYDVSSAGYEFIQARQAAEQALRDAAALARSIAPETTVSTRLHFGAALPALRAESTGAGLLVVGHRGLSGVRGLPTGSVAVRVSARAGCPTVVIHPRDPTVPRTSPPCPRPPQVVVGVDTTPWCASAIGFAFQAAHQRGIRLTAVHACPPEALPGLREADAVNGADPHSVGPHSDALDGDGLDAGGAAFEKGASSVPPGVACSLDNLDQELVVEQAVDYWRTIYPDVAVVTKVMRNDPARALISESVGAALLVVGTPRPGRLWGLLHASVSKAVLHCAQSPVAVVGHRYTPPECEQPQPWASAPVHHPLPHQERS
jgi:nucleotide-binding universal stress UspA family protein